MILHLSTLVNGQKEDNYFYFFVTVRKISEINFNRIQKLNAHTHTKQ